MRFSDYRGRRRPGITLGEPGRYSVSHVTMPNAAIVLNLLFFPSIIAATAILFWVFRETKKAGIWPTEKFFGFEIRSPYRVFAVIKLLRQHIQSTEDAVEERRYRRWLNAIFLGYSLGLFALAVFLAFVPWLYSQIP